MISFSWSQVCKRFHTAFFMTSWFEYLHLKDPRQARVQGKSALALPGLRIDTRFVVSRSIHDELYYYEFCF